MTDRLIISEVDGGWSASLANTIVSYSFLGGEEAGDNIQALALGMKHAKQLVIDGIDEDLIFNRGGETGAEIYDSLFPTTNSLQYEGNVIFTATEGATLDAELELAGDALGAALLLRIASSKLSSGNAATHDNLRIIKIINSLWNTDTFDSTSSQFSITTTNLHKATFDLVTTGDPHSFWPVGWPEQNVSSPTNQLIYPGLEILAFNCSASNVAIGPFDASLVYKNGDVYFGTRLHVPYQFLHAGDSPSYQVCYKTPQETKGWFWPVSDPSTSWDFPKELGFKVRVDATAGGQNLNLNVTVSDFRPEQD